MEKSVTIEVPIEGMDCAECTRHVQGAIARIPGVNSAEVFLASEKALVNLDQSQVEMETIRLAVKEAGYEVPDKSEHVQNQSKFGIKSTLFILILLSGTLILIVLGEWLGFIETITDHIPWPLGLAIVLVIGYPIFRKVFFAARQRQVTSHTLMTIGALAAMLAGVWATAIIIVFFMRVGDYIENFTTGRARQAIKDLKLLAPQTARVLIRDEEVLLPIEDVHPGDVIIVRPGEKIPVDGDVIAGNATVDQSSITGESIPLEAGPGARVYAASIIGDGSLRIETLTVGMETTFGKVLKLVEEAESYQSDIQRFADKFSVYYLPIVLAIATLTLIFSRNPSSTVAVLVVACSCSIALSTPIAMMASIGAAARKGLMIKGGKYLELLAQADVLLLDKTGTLTLGKPQVTDVISHDGFSAEAVLVMAGSAERYSEHPLAEAIRVEVVRRGLNLFEPHRFVSLTGLGVRAEVEEKTVTVGSERLVGAGMISGNELFEKEGKTIIYVEMEEQLIGRIAIQDTLRSEVPNALNEIRRLGISQIELLTGDNESIASSVAKELGIDYKANLLPEDKIRIVRSYQQKGQIVIMVGDGINDAPALAQADIGIAMGVAGSDVALEAAGAALMREDWFLIPELIQISRRTMRVVRGNLGFTAFYNIIGLSLAAFGIIPPALAAAAQSIPDLGILANSSRLLRQSSNGGARMNK